MGQECSVTAAERRHKRAGRLAHVRVPEGAPCQPGVGAHRYLLQAELQAAVMHHDVEELHHAELQRCCRDPLAADPLRVHDPGRAGSPQLGLRRLSAGVGDEDTVRPQRRADSVT